MQRDRQTLARGRRQPPIIVAGEGLETIMSLGMAMPTLLMIAGLSASHLAALLLPLSLGRLYIALDPDPAATGELAARSGGAPLISR